MTREQAIAFAKQMLHTQTADQLAALLSRLTGKWHTCDEDSITMTTDDTKDVVFIMEYFSGWDYTGMTFFEMAEWISRDTLPEGMFTYAEFENYSPAELYNRCYKGHF